MHNLILFFVGMFIGNVLLAQDKIAITSATELPQLVHQLPDQSAWSLIEDRAALTELADPVKQDLLDVLAKYDIQDRSTLRGWYSQLLTIALFEGDMETAIQYVQVMRELGDKPIEKIMSGSLTLARVQAINASGQTEGPAYKEAVAAELAKRLEEVPFEVAREAVEGFLGSVELMSADMIEKSVKGQFQPVLDQMGSNVPANVIVGIIDVRNTLDIHIVLKEEMKAVYQAYYDKHQDGSAPTDIWADRDFELPASDQLTPIRIGIWDSGVDMDALPVQQRHANAAEVADGKDNDGNGYVDDVHGIAYDVDRHKSASLLLPLREAMQYDLKTLQGYMKGSMDLRAGLNTTEDAKAFVMTYQSLEAEEMQAFGTEVGWYGNYAHGTHVAGIAAAGNPQARVMAARLEWSTDPIPPAPTMAQSERTASMYRETVAYFQQQGVRVVNMSWRYGAPAYEQLLMLHNIGETPEARREMALELFEVEKKALYEAIAGAEDILFVAGSGNENNDADFVGYIPASFELPNLLTVGAVDSEGKRTSFTSEGASVDCYANGYEVESYIPGGDRIAMSGTSMASPQVANLAGKLLSANPNLTVSELRALIESACDTSDEGIRLINPKQSLILLQQEMMKQAR